MFKSFELRPLAEFGEAATFKLFQALGRCAGYAVPFDLLPSFVAGDAILPGGYAIHVSLDSILVPEDPALELLLAVLQVVVEILFQLCFATFAGSRQRLTHLTLLFINNNNNQSPFAVTVLSPFCHLWVDSEGDSALSPFDAASSDLRIGLLLVPKPLIPGFFCEINQNERQPVIRTKKFYGSATLDGKY